MDTNEWCTDLDLGPGVQKPRSKKQCVDDVKHWCVLGYMLGVPGVERGETAGWKIGGGLTFPFKHVEPEVSVEREWSDSVNVIHDGQTGYKEACKKAATQAALNICTKVRHECNQARGCSGE